MRRTPLIMRFVCAIFLCVTLFSVATMLIIEAPTRRDSGHELHGQFLQNHRFIVGVNYPWLNYGGDFGTSEWGHFGLSEPASEGIVDSDFAYLASKGVKFVRWFVLCDGRSGLLYANDGTVAGVDAYFFKDLDTLIRLAEKHDVYLILVLLDFSLFNPASLHAGVQAGGRGDLVVDSKQRSAFLENVLKPILKRYGQIGHIVAWEVMNEPEWMMDMRGGRGIKTPIKVDVMRSFVKDCVDMVHALTEQSATLGSASRRWVEKWTGLGLDFYQIHYYPWMESTYPLNFDADYIKVDKPVIIGEYPTQRAVWPIERYLRLALKNHYAGTFAWSLRSRDKFSDYFSHAEEVVQWRKDNANAIGY